MKTMMEKMAFLLMSLAAVGCQSLASSPHDYYRANMSSGWHGSRAQQYVAEKLSKEDLRKIDQRIKQEEEMEEAILRNLANPPRPTIILIEK